MIKNIKRLVIGSASAKIIGIALMPLITRLYTPEDMGKAAQFVSIMLIVAPMLSLRYCLAIPLPKSNRAASILVNISLWSSLIIAVSLIVLTFFFKNQVVALLGLEGISDYLYFLIFTAFILSLQETYSFWVARVKDFKLISKVIFKQSLIGGVVKVTLGILHPSALSLILGNAFQYSAGTVSYFLSYKEMKVTYIKNMSRLFKVARYYADFVYFKVPSHFLYIVAAQLPILYCSKYFDIGLVGQLSLAISLISIPVNVISQSVSKVYYSEISSLGQSNIKEIYKLTILTLKKLVVLGVLMFSVVFILSPTVFEFVFGDKWVVAGELGRALSLVLVFQISATTLITALNVLKLNYAAFIMHATRLILIGAVFYVSKIRGFDMVWSIYFYSLVLSLHYFFVICFVLLKMNRGQRVI
ncbi:oligosaccharide flippase family protein [Pseudoalteromonas sp. P1-8]|uniref:oligosaccharide flippase family protein n=1 Tax=Pseudoalteromonas sp. P1-8 TaxID=1710353 RepID=UPI0006DC0378|nr:oligosaccharide flippase family protein [Pseudoalteromonas sp. P1-8]KPV96917.1 hypothetical protein AN213_03883 [Pseudoalteromonas sp. P1-8]